MKLIWFCPWLSDPINQWAKLNRFAISRVDYSIYYDLHEALYSLIFLYD